ncbi:MAG: helix-turn-helix domain-containing protein [Clostridia bacterium]|nr:helix-turn-helix domain-containing protein [Clostridia bacterium]
MKRLKELREEYQKTQKEIAAYLNIKQNTYSQYENGKRQVPNDILLRIADYYDVSTDYLFGRTDEEGKYFSIAYRNYALKRMIYKEI